MYNAATVVTQFATLAGYVGTMLLASITAILAGAVALLGLGFGTRKLIEHVTGGGTWGGPALRGNVNWDKLEEMEGKYHGEGF